MRAGWRTMKTLLGTLLVEERSQSTIEYALLCGIIAVAAMTVLQSIRGNMVSVFSTIETELENATVGDAG